MTQRGADARTWRRSRRVRALLSAGLVLGVGAAATLAAWNDAEHSSASFEAGTFGIVGSTSGTTFSEHPAADPAELSFSPGVAALAPGDSVYALFSVRTIPGSVAGTVRLSAAGVNSTGLGQWLTYSVRTIDSLTCNAAAFAGGNPNGLPQGESLTTSASGTRTLAADGAEQMNFCFEVTLPTSAPNHAQGTGVNANWTFSAQSS